MRFVRHPAEQTAFATGPGNEDRSTRGSNRYHRSARTLSMPSSSDATSRFMKGFELLGADLRITSSSHLIYYCPKITNDNRLPWEEYALENRFLANHYRREEAFRVQQDIEFGYISPERAFELEEQQQEQNSPNNETDSGHERRDLQQESESPPQPPTMLDDGTNYHPRIWSNGAVNPLGDEPEGSGPFFALWQQRYDTF